MSRQAIPAVTEGSRALGGMCHPPSDQKACSAWRLVSNSRRYCCSRNCAACLDVHDLQGFDDISKFGLLVFFELWLKSYPLSCGSG